MQGTKIKLLEHRPDGFPRPGDAWYLPAAELKASKIKTSMSYRRDSMGKRLPLVVKLPDETELNLDAVGKDGTSYTVTGEGESITVEPAVLGRSGKLFRIHNGFIQDASTKQAAAEATE